jgi:hypothetical protein
MTDVLTRGVSESIAFSVPDRNTLWNRVEDGLLVVDVAKHSTSDVLGRDWSEVVSELSGCSEQQCKERYSLSDTVVELTFVFLRVMPYVLSNQAMFPVSVILLLTSCLRYLFGGTLVGISFPRI